MKRYVMIVILGFGMVAWHGAYAGGEEQQRQDRTKGLFRSQIHRGGGYNARPDNALETFLWCWGRGAAPEADVRVTKDGVAIALHDSTLKRVGRGIDEKSAEKWVGSLTWAEIRDVDVGSYLDPAYSSVRVSTAESIFAAMKGRPNRYLYLDEKGVPVKLAAEMVRSYGIEGQVCFTSSKFDKVREWRSLVPNGDTMVWIGAWPKRIDAAERARVEKHLADTLAEIEDVGFADVTQIQIHVHLDMRQTGDWFAPSSDCLAKTVRHLHDKGVRVQAGVWGGYSERHEAFDRLWELGFDSFATDWPNEYLAWQQKVGK